jgi:hypothetical protein
MNEIFSNSVNIKFLLYSSHIAKTVHRMVNKPDKVPASHKFIVQCKR